VGNICWCCQLLLWNTATISKKVKLAGKPGSVVDSHSSRRFVTLRSSNLPADDASSVIVSLFGLAPDGVYPATDVATSAVSSYLAISPLPIYRNKLAVYFLWHFPSPHGVRPLTGIPLYGARTFLPALQAERKIRVPPNFGFGITCLRKLAYTATCTLARSSCPPRPCGRGDCLASFGAESITCASGKSDEVIGKSARLHHHFSNVLPSHRPAMPKAITGR